VGNSIRFVKFNYFNECFGGQPRLREPAQSAIGLLFSIFGLSFSDPLIIQVGFVMRPSERPFEVTLFIQ
jgi:hypothetical protein